MTRPTAMPLVVFGLVVGLAGLAACERTTTRTPHQMANGEVFYTEQTQPSVGESFFHAVTHDCAGGVNDEAGALALVPTRAGCKRDSFVASYVVDGVFKIEACDEVWRVRCRKSPSLSAPSGPLDCSVSCEVEDHFTPVK